VLQSQVNWDAAASAATVDSGLGDTTRHPGLSRAARQVETLNKRVIGLEKKPRDLTGLLQVNATAARVIPHVASAGVPVLLPFEIDRLASDLYSAAKPAQRAAKSYLNNLRLTEFQPEKNGYSAQFNTGTGRDVSIFASSAFVALDGSDLSPSQAEEPVFTETEFAKEAEFFRYGVAYKISLSCVPIAKDDGLCRDDAYLKGLVSRLKVVGGVPQK
jgi:hypothetical protein